VVAGEGDTIALGSVEMHGRRGTRGAVVAIASSTILAAIGCGGPPSPKGPTASSSSASSSSSALSPPSSSAAASAASAAHPTPASARAACQKVMSDWASAHPSSSTPPRAGAPRCTPIAPEISRAVVAELTAAYQRVSSRKVKVDLGCDPLGDLREIVIEESEDGAELRMLRLGTSADGAGHELRLLVYQPVCALRRPAEDGAPAGGAATPDWPGSGGGPPDCVGLAHLPWPPVDPAALARSRASLVATLRAVDVPPGAPGSMSSHSVHRHLHMRDSTGHVLARDYTGQLGTTADVETPPLALAQRALGLAETAAAQGGSPHPLETGPVTDADRELFTQRFLALASTPSHMTWWLEQRLLGMAVFVGSGALVPRLLLLGQLAGPDGSRDRARVVAFRALAAITGVDLTKDPTTRKARPLDDVARDYTAACAP